MGNWLASTVQCGIGAAKGAGLTWMAAVSRGTPASRCAWACPVMSWACPTVSAGSPVACSPRVDGMPGQADASGGTEAPAEQGAQFGPGRSPRREARRSWLAYPTDMGVGSVAPAVHQGQVLQRPTISMRQSSTVNPSWLNWDSLGSSLAARRSWTRPQLRQTRWSWRPGPQAR